VTPRHALSDRGKDPVGCTTLHYPNGETFVILVALRKLAHALRAISYPIYSQMPGWMFKDQVVTACVALGKLH